MRLDLDMIEIAMIAVVVSVQSDEISFLSRVSMSKTLFLYFAMLVESNKAGKREQRTYTFHCPPTSTSKIFEVKKFHLVIENECSKDETQFPRNANSHGRIATKWNMGNLFDGTRQRDGGRCDQIGLNQNNQHSLHEIKLNRSGWRQPREFVQ